jgi:hypothetical protein
MRRKGFTGLCRRKDMIAAYNNLCFRNSGALDRLQVSTNPLHWSSVNTSTILVSGTTNLSNAISDYNRRFYRVYLQ